MPFKNPHPYYSIWQGMKARCNNKNNQSYHRYGGLGIDVCEKWTHDFKSFVNDMGERPTGYTLERIDNDKGYSPDNCKWASRQEQQLNRDAVNRFIIDNKIVTPCLLAKEIGLKSDTILNRVKRNLSFDEIISPDRKKDISGLKLGGKANGKRQKAKTHCPNGHEYTVDNILANKDGWRRCKTCHREKEMARRLLRDIANHPNYE